MHAIVLMRIGNSGVTQKPKQVHDYTWPVYFFIHKVCNHENLKEDENE